MNGKGGWKRRKKVAAMKRAREESKRVEKRRLKFLGRREMKGEKVGDWRTEIMKIQDS